MAEPTGLLDLPNEILSLILKALIDDPEVSLTEFLRISHSCEALMNVYVSQEPLIISYYIRKARAVGEESRFVLKLMGYGSNAPSMNFWTVIRAFKLACSDKDPPETADEDKKNPKSSKISEEWGSLHVD